MKRIGMIGKASRDKTFLMMYLGKILSQGLEVCVVTRDQWFMPEISSFEYNERMTVAAVQTEPVTADVVIMDVSEEKWDEMDLAVCISDIDRLGVEANERLFEVSAEAEERLYLFINMLFDSKINEKYLCNRFGIDRRSEKVLSLYLDDGDMAVHVENGYNDSLDIRGLSKAYKKLLLALAAHSGTELRTLKRWLRMAERSK